MAVFKYTYLKSLLPFALCFFGSLCTECSGTQMETDNKYITAVYPKRFSDVTDYAQGEILHLVKFSKPGNRALYGGLQSIISIDNIQDVALQSNSETILGSTPSERLGLIEKFSLYDESFEWSDFKIVSPVTETSLMGYDAAEAIFSVRERVEYMDTVIDRKIKRMVVFTDDDLWNIVIAPTSADLYDKEMKLFEEILRSAEIK